MKRDSNLKVESNKSKDGQVYPLYAHDMARLLDCDTRSIDALIQSLPFSSDDTTAGTETELQASVIGRKDDVDLSIMIENSNYYFNIYMGLRRPLHFWGLQSVPLASPFSIINELTSF